MGFYELRRTPPAIGLLAVTIASAAFGCRSFEAPTDLAATLAASESALAQNSAAPLRSGALLSESFVGPEIKDDSWAIVPANPENHDAPTFRWQNASLSKLLARAPEDQPDLVMLLGAEDPVAATNAAILLARAGDESVDRCLIEAVRNERLKLPQRRAAVEAIAGEDGAVAGPALAELLDDFADPEAAHYSPELHAELLRGLVKHVDAAASPYFGDALESKNAEVRQAGLQAYTTSRTGVLPAKAAELRKDTNPRVRAAALTCLAVRQHPQALEYAEAALADFHLDVRLAAVQALGELGGPKARTDLQRLLMHEPEMIRAGAIRALATAGDDVTVFASANDASWQVRRSVAQSLTRFSTPRGSTIARQLLADRSTEVRRAVVESLAAWPLAQAAPILLTAMGDTPLPTRKQAADQLAQRWQPAGEFDSEASAERRQEQLAAIHRLWQQEPAASETWTLPLAEEATGGASPSALPPTALEAHHQVLDASNPVLAVVSQLVVEDVHARREAAHRLADLAEETPLGEDIVTQLAELAMAETDPLVWRELLRAVDGSACPAATRMAYVGASHAAADVRRLSCGYLAAHPDPEHTPILVRLFDDPNRAVVLAAIEGVSAPGTVTDAVPLERLLSGDDAHVRVAAAKALAINGFSTGSAALTRFATDADIETRRLAVGAMGQLRDVAYLGPLVGRLDDELSVRLASVASLAQIVGHDVNVRENQSPPALADQVQGWKQWWAEQPEQSARLNPTAAGVRR